MAEAGMTAFGITLLVAIALAVVCFALYLKRQKKTLVPKE